MKVIYQIDTITFPARAPLSFDKTYVIIKNFLEEYYETIENILYDARKEQNKSVDDLKLEVTIKDFNSYKLIGVNCYITGTEHPYIVCENENVEVGGEIHLC